MSAAPERGRANDAVVGLLAERLGVPRSVGLDGSHSRDKVVELRGLAKGEAERRLDATPARRTGQRGQEPSFLDHLRPKRTELA